MEGGVEGSVRDSRDSVRYLRDSVRDSRDSCTSARVWVWAAGAVEAEVQEVIPNFQDTCGLASHKPCERLEGQASVPHKFLLKALRHHVPESLSHYSKLPNWHKEALPLFLSHLHRH
eukprot:1161449-Pelagomonas_calceolata.AAC.9